MSSTTTMRSRPGASSRLARSRMSTREALAVATCVIVFGGCAGTAPRETPNLGRAATQAEIAGWTSASLRRSGLPRGAGRRPTAHWSMPEVPGLPWDKGVGGPNDRLVGGQGTLASKTPVRTIAATGPTRRPCSTTSGDRCRSSTALADGQRGLRGHRLSAQLNGIIGEQDVMNAETPSQSEDAQPRQLHSGPALEAPVQ